MLLVVMSITTMIPSLSSACLLLLTSSLSKTWEVRGEVYASFFAGQVHSRSSSQPASFAGQVHCDQIKTSKATQHQAMQIVKKYLILPIVVGGSCMSILNSSLGEEIKVGLQPLPSMVLAAMPTLPSNSMGKSNPAQKSPGRRQLMRPSRTSDKPSKPMRRRKRHSNSSTGIKRSSSRRRQIQIGPKWNS